MINRNHEDKKRLARRLMTPEEIANKTSIFESNAWKTRKTSIERRVDQTIANQQLMKAKKELAKKEKAKNENNNA